MKYVLGFIGLALSGLYIGMREYLTRRPETYLPALNSLGHDRR